MLELKSSKIITEIAITTIVILINLINEHFKIMENFSLDFVKLKYQSTCLSLKQELWKGL